ncbi:MAG: DapH/DapD/GlmU-related protein [Bacteroidia bacterium]
MKSKKITFKDIEKILSGTAFEFIGNKKNVLIEKANTTSDAGPHSVTWIKPSANSEKIFKGLKAGLVVIDKKTNKKSLNKRSNFILTENPKLVYAQIVNHFFTEKKQGTVHPTATVSVKAVIGKNVYIGPNVVIGKCTIGDNTELIGNTFLYDNVTIGKNCIINAGCVLGAPGSGYVQNAKKEWIRFPQIGTTVLEDNVEVGALSYINRGALGETRIKKGAKIGLSVCIGHNVTIGKNAMIIANCVVAGGTTVGDNAWVSHGAVLRNGLTIGDDAFIAMGAVVVKDVPKGKLVMGNPAKEKK